MRKELATAEMHYSVLANAFLSDVKQAPQEIKQRLAILIDMYRSK